MVNYIEKPTLKIFVEILNDPDRKSLPRMMYELLDLLFFYRELPSHYFSRYLFKKWNTNIRNYLPNKLLGERISPFFYDRSVKEVLDNKLFFAFFYGQFLSDLPKLLMYNHRKMFVINDNSVIINTVEEFSDLLEELFKNNPSVGSMIIKKTRASSGGSNIYKLSPGELKGNTELLSKIYSEAICSGFLFQETVKQHPDLNKLNPSSLNTIRIDSFIDSDGNINLISAYIRMSINNLHIDNISSGGCSVGVDFQTGKLKKIAYSDLRMVGVKVFTEHPITKTVFEDFTVPHFEEVKALALKTASFIPGLRLVGWDIAIGESGPVLIEGNFDYEIRGNDFADGGYLVNPAFRKVLKEVKYL
jgi:hypothetical protein